MLDGGWVDLAASFRDSRDEQVRDQFADNARSIAPASTAARGMSAGSRVDAKVPRRVQI